MRRAGTPIPVNAVWIAATATECNGHFLTYDTDYRRVNGLDYTLLERRHEGRGEPAFSYSPARLSKALDLVGEAMVVIVPMTTTKNVEA